MAALTSPLDTTDLANSCVIWLDAADITTMAQLSTGQTPVSIDGDPVGYWLNKAPQNTLNTYLGLSSFNNYYGLVAARPTYKTISVPNLSLPALYFDGGDYLTSRFSTIAYTQQTTFVVVSPGAAGRLFSQTPSGVADSTAPAYVPASAASSTSVGSHVNNLSQATVPFRGSSFFDIFTSVHSGTNITNFVNGASLAQFANSLTLSINTSRVGAGIASTNATNGTTFTGYIAEVIVYNRALTDAERARVEMYLGTKWNLPRHIYAQQTGDWSDPNTWFDTNVPSLSNDHVYTNNYYVTIDQNVLVQSLRNHALAPNIASGGLFYIPQAVSIATLSGIGFYTNSSTTLLYSGANSGTVALTGHLIGGTSGVCRGYVQIGNASLSLSGIVRGGTSNNCAGVYLSGNSLLNATIGKGSITGGTGTNSPGVYIQAEQISFSNEGPITAGSGSGSRGVFIDGFVSSFVSTNGNITAGAAVNSEGVYLTNANNLVLSGNILGSSLSEGMFLSGFSSCSITLTGNAAGGSGATCHGLEYRGFGDLNINGANVVNRLPSNFTGGSGLSSHGLYFSGEGNLSLSGTATGGSTNACGIYLENKNSNLYCQGLSGGSGIRSFGAYILSGSGDITIDGNVIAGTNTEAYGCYSNRVYTDSNRVCTVTVNNGTIRGSNTSSITRCRGLVVDAFRWNSLWSGPIFTPPTTFNLNNVNIIGGNGNQDTIGLVVPEGQKANITGNVTGGSGHPGIQINSESDVKIIGTVTGGAASGIINYEGNLTVIGLVQGAPSSTGAGINSQGGNTYVEGTVTGGSGSGTSVGISHTSNQTQTPTTTVRGNVIGGTLQDSCGITHHTAGILQVFGNAIANPTTGTNAIVNGDGSAATSYYVYGIPTVAEGNPSGGTYITAAYGYFSKNYICGNVIDAPNGGTAIWAFQYNYEPALTNAVTTYSTTLDQQLNMYTSDCLSAFSMPPVSAVRSGVKFANNSLIGTCIIPDPKSVKYRMPVDNTEGYAILDPVDLFNVSVSKLSAQGTLGNRLKNSLTIQTAGEIIQSFS